MLDRVCKGELAGRLVDYLRIEAPLISVGDVRLIQLIFGRGRFPIQFHPGELQSAFLKQKQCHFPVKVGISRRCKTARLPKALSPTLVQIHEMFPGRFE